MITDRGWENIYCRGSWYNLQFSNGELHFSVESAWGELNVVRQFIEEKFPSIKLYYQYEESGMAIYQTNDDIEEYFPKKHYLWVDDGKTMYYNTLEALIKDVEGITTQRISRHSTPV